MQGRSESESGCGRPDLGDPHDRKAEMLVDGSETVSQQTGTVGVSVAARAAMLPMLRAVVETVLLTADFTIDVVTDVRVAIDEVATALIVAAGSDAQIDCDLRYDPQQLEVRMTAVTLTRNVLQEDELSRHLLDSLTDSMNIEPGEVDEGLRGYRTVVHFSRRRG